MAPDEAESESGLLDQARGGSVLAFEEIVRRYQRRVYATAYRIVRRHEVADDVAQEAFIRAHRSLDRFDTRRPFGPWICRIAANLAGNHVRSPQAREDALPDGHAETPSAAPGPLQGVLDTEARAMLDRALGELPALEWLFLDNTQFSGRGLPALRIGPPARERPPEQRGVPRHRGVLEGNERPPDGREQIKAAYLYRYTLLLLLGAPMVSSTNSSGYSVKALRSSFVASTQSTARGRITPPERWR